MNSEQFSLSRAFSEIKSWRQTFTWLGTGTGTGTGGDVDTNRRTK